MSIASDNLRNTHRTVVLRILTWIIPGVGLVEAPTAAAARFAALPLYRNGHRTMAAVVAAARVLYPGWDDFRPTSRVELAAETGRFLTWMESTEEGPLPGMPFVSLDKHSVEQFRAAERAAIVRAAREDVLASWREQPLGRWHHDGNRWHVLGYRPTISYRKAGAVVTIDGEPAQPCERCHTLAVVDSWFGLCDDCQAYNADRYIA